MGFKKAGFGAGKYAGIGGKVEPGETVEAAAIREVEEDLRFMGTVIFLFPSKPEWNQKVSIYVVEDWSEEPGESNEMRPASFKVDEILYGSMWQDAWIWIPPILDGKKIEAKFVFKEDKETVGNMAVNLL